MNHSLAFLTLWSCDCILKPLLYILSCYCMTWSIWEILLFKKKWFFSLIFGILFIQSESCEVSWVPLKYELKSPSNLIWIASLYSLLKCIPGERHKTL